MLLDMGRLWMRIKSAQALRQYMEYRRETNRSLAKKAGLGQAIIGHLRSGERKTCSAATARAIEEALQCPPEFLFVPSIASSQLAGSKDAA